MMTGVPDRTEATDYYYGYIEKVAGDDICAILQTQQDETLDFLSGIPDSASLHRYAPDKWSIREVAGHVNDAERLFVSRAFWFARGFDTALPSFDQHVAVAAAGADARPWHCHVEEFRAVRAATLTFFRGLPPEAWSRRGIASGHRFTVRALAFIAAGHVIHHNQILRERYLAIE